jgi:hypothetical protein
MKSWSNRVSVLSGRELPERDFELLPYDLEIRERFFLPLYRIAPDDRYLLPVQILDLEDEVAERANPRAVEELEPGEIDDEGIGVEAVHVEHEPFDLFESRDIVEPEAPLEGEGLRIFFVDDFEKIAFDSHATDSLC